MSVPDGGLGDGGGEVLLESGHHPGQGLALLAPEAPTEFGTQYLVDLVDLLGEGGTVGRDRDEPDPTIVGLRLALDEAASLQAVDHRADRGPADAKMVGEVGLRGRTEFVDVADQRRLREVEVERCQPGVERDADERAVAINVDSTRSHGGESSSWVVRLAVFMTFGVDTYCTMPYSIATADRCDIFLEDMT